MTTDGRDAAAEAFVARWSPSSGAERSNFQSFIVELCELLEVQPPDPATHNESENDYVFDVLKPCVKKIGYDLIDMRDVTEAGLIDNILRARIRDAAFVIADLKHAGPFSFHGEYGGRAGVQELLANASKDYIFHHMTPKEVAAAGDVVWGYFDVGLRYDAKGRATEPKVVQLDIAIRWRLKDGKIIEHQAFFDTAHLMILQKNLQL